MAGRQAVLVIDDEPNMTWLFKEALGHRYDVVGAQDGRSGLEVVSTQPVDVVLLDLRLPDMDGLKGIHEIRRVNSNLPVIMMTAYATVKNAVEAMKAGAYDYVVKPFEVAEVEKVIREALAETPSIFKNLEGWMRRRLRMCLWKQWKRVRTRYRELRALGLPERVVHEFANTRKGPWRMAQGPMNRALGNSYW
ncbi:retron-type reverse transcriptase [Calderihabitans maritimus]|uniref:Stage 0 sporulation protein A homolog n=1 Tax=Calderihabitans maritimus TaxID=1246530 RepID=A0A1Z5HUB2_9FIRM|nr:response regulator [Calderihabitans maritimus]GAW93102.1 retron-type reverse transcriptase [Calderihabitans maritimus]